MIKVFLFVAMLFSLNANATLDNKTYCNGGIIHWNLYQITFEPYTAPHSLGRLEFWMAFNRNGSPIPATFWFAYDTYLLSNDVIVYVLPSETYLNTRFNSDNNARGCYTQARIQGISFDSNNNTYEYVIQGSGFISRDNSSSGSDADMFTLNNAQITYGGVTRWGKLSFTQIR